MEFWIHPTQGKIWTGDSKKHPDQKERLEEQGWTRVKGREDWSPFKKPAKRKAKKK